MAKKFIYDVFLSHSSKDKVIVRELARRLSADGVRVWLDETEIRPGDLIGLKIEHALEQSRTLVLCMSHNAFASEWVTLERHTALFRDPTNARRRFVPIRLDEAEPTDTLKQFAYIDWRLRSESEYARLLAACARSSEEDVAERGSNTPIEGTVLTGHGGPVWRVAITPDGRWAVSGSEDATVRMWDLHTRQQVAHFEGHNDAVNGVAIAPDGRLVVSGDDVGTLRVWEVASRRRIARLTALGPLASYGVTFTSDSTRIMSVSGCTARLWNIDSSKCIKEIDVDYGGSEYNSGLAVTQDGRRFLVGAGNLACVWDLDTEEVIGVLKGHKDAVSAVAVTADGHRAVSTSVDRTIRVWDLDSFRCLAALEGHTAEVHGISITPDGRRAADGTVRIWDLAYGECMAVVKGHTAAVNDVAMTADSSRVVSSSEDTTVRVWDLLPLTASTGNVTEATRYTNAKVLIVGESGVGKTGLTQRLVEDRFEATTSTDGAWATQMKLPNAARVDDVEREIWLWDFAGQADYRLIHQLFMDETALAVLVFNPQPWSMSSRAHRSGDVACFSILFQARTTRSGGPSGHPGQLSILWRC